MTGFEESDFVVSDEVVAMARRLGMVGRIRERIQHYALYAGKFTHPDGLANARYEQWIMRIDGVNVLWIDRLDPFCLSGYAESGWISAASSAEIANGHRRETVPARSR